MRKTSKHDALKRHVIKYANGRERCPDWQIAEYGIRELKAKYLCIKHGNRTIARIDAHGNSLSVTKEDESNARLIVASVNHAGKLAEALERLDMAHNHETLCRAKEHARATLADWKEAQK